MTQPADNVVDLGKRWAQELKEQGAPPVSGSYDDSWMVDNPDTIEGPPPPEDDDQPKVELSTCLDWDDLLTREPPPRSWLINNWLTDGITLLSGRGGYGKSLISQAIATSLASASYYLTDVREPARVLIWSCEDDQNELWRRQVAINSHFGIDAQALRENLFIAPRHNLNNQLVVKAYGRLTTTPAYENLKADVGRIQPRVLILDNAGHVFGGNENDRGDVTTFGNLLTALSDGPLAIILVSHPAKAGESEWSGSTAWENVARNRWLLDKRKPSDAKRNAENDPLEDVDTTVRYLSVRKTNYGVEDVAKLVYVNGLFIPDSSFAAQVSRGEPAYRREHVQRMLLEAVRVLTDRNVELSLSPNSPHYLPKVVLQWRLADDVQSPELARAMRDLVKDERLVNATIGKNNKGDPIKRLILKF